MEKEDLIKKLEKAELPDIEVLSHKRRLKQSLINWKYQEKGFGTGFGIFKKIAFPVGTVVSLVIIALILSNILFPQYTLAEAREIALKDPQVKEWIDMGAEIKDIEIIKNKAYVLVSPKAPSTETRQSIEESAKYKFEGALVEIKMGTKEVSNIEGIAPQIIPLTNHEKERTLQIIEEQETSQTGYRKIEVMNIEPVPTPPYQLKLEVRGKKVEVLPERQGYQKVRIIYDVNGERKEGEVNVTEEKVERIEILERYKKRE